MTEEQKMVAQTVEEVEKVVIEQLICQLFNRSTLPNIHKNLPIVTNKTFKQATL